MIIGIDLGTTNSLAAYFTEQGAKIIPNRLGGYLTPSVVSIDETGQILVGETAKERMLLYPECSASVFKRSMGTDQVFKLGNKSFTAEELSSFVLRMLKEDAETYLGEKVEEAVISVPAYFNDVRRKATKRAGELAGFKVERIISEPTAAAISYGLYQQEKHTRFLVFDLGGGTFDVSILELYGSILEVRAVAGDNFLGGEDFTKVLIDAFFEHYPHLESNHLGEKVYRHIYKQAEACKKTWQKGKGEMTCHINGEILHFEMTSEAYEQACEPLFDKMRQPIKRSLMDAQVKTSDIDKIVLVGGATKLPMVRKFVSKLFKCMPDMTVNPDEAVALGAAIQAAMKARHQAIKEVILTDVCPFTLGTEVAIEREDHRLEGGHVCPIIERNTVIPVSHTERVYTIRDHQEKICVNVLQGESRFASNNLSLGKIEVAVPKNQAGEEAIDITYTYDINGILEVEIRVVSTGKVVSKIIKGQYTPMTDEEIKERMEALSYLKISPREEEENKLLLAQGERVYEESLGMNRKRIEVALEQFERILDTKDQEKIVKARKELEAFLKEFL